MNIYLKLSPCLISFTLFLSSFSAYSADEVVVEQENTEIIDINIMPHDFVLVNPLLDSANIEIAYYTQNNFLGTKVDGYNANLCILHEDVANALIDVSKNAIEQGYRLKIFDCYRPQSAVDHFVRWANDLDDQETKKNYYPDIDKATLIGPYIASKSSHSRGVAVDLTLEKLDEDGTWNELPMGTRFDYFNSRSNTFSELVSEKYISNRKILVDLMASEGFVNYKMEWWHYSHHPQKYTETFFNFPVE